MSEMNEKWFNLQEATQVSGVSYAVLNKALREGKLVGKQISDSSRYGYHWLVSETALLQWVEDRKTVKAHAIATSKVPSELTIEDIAQEITLRIQKAYETGLRDGKKAGKAEIMDAIKGVK